MSEEDGTADCSHMIFGVRWSPEFSVLAPQVAGPARRSYPCLGHISRSEAALSNAPPPGNASAAILNAAAVTGLILLWAKTDSPSVMYIRPEETDNHLPRSGVALRFPVTRKMCRHHRASGNARCILLRRD